MGNTRKKRQRSEALMHRARNENGEEGVRVRDARTLFSLVFAGGLPDFASRTFDVLRASCSLGRFCLKIWTCS